MRFRLEWFHGLLAEVDEDLLLADHGGTVLEPKRRDRVGAHDLSEAVLASRSTGTWRLM